MKTNLKLSIIFLFFALLVFDSSTTNAEDVNIDAGKLLARVEISLSPRSGSFVEGSTFELPILINTKNRSINGVEVKVNFDKNKLMIINPTGGTSIIGIWTEPPKYDNTRGTASYVGVVPGGITTGSGLVGVITFKAISRGNAVISIGSNSRILLNDGLGTETQVDPGRANYSILAKAPEGVQIFSETHPVPSDWYNNNTPVVSWIKDEGVNDFSFILDNKPNTIPDNVSDGDMTTKSFEKLSDGLWYFHVKAQKGGIWGTAGHFLARIDTAPPAEFTVENNFLVASVIETKRALISFFTTDNLSGVDHYEVGVIDKNQAFTESPVFIQAESPFQVPVSKNSKLEVIVRAIDKAGNVRDESVDVRIPFVITNFINQYIVSILMGIILLGFVILILHYLVGHHIVRYIGKARQIIKKENIIRVEQENNLPVEINNGYINKDSAHNNLIDRIR